MAEVDTSTYPGRTQQPSSLDYLNAALNARNLNNQNKLFQQQFQTNLATSQIMKEAIDPITGQFDRDKFNTLLQSNPNASLGLGEALHQGQALQQGNVAIEQSKLDLALKHGQAMEGIFGQLASNPNLSKKDILNSAAEMINQGLITQPEALSELANLPPDDNPQQLRGWAVSHLQRYGAMNGHLAQYLPQASGVNTGAGTSFQDVNPVTNPGITGTYVPNQLSPGTPVVGPDNALHALGPQGAPTVTPGGSSPLAGTIQPPQNMAPRAAPGVPPGGNPAGLGPQLSLAPGVADAAAVQAHASAAQGVALQQMADQIPAQKAILGNLEGLIKNFTPGPGAEWRRVAGAFGNVAPQVFGGSGFNPKAIASQEEFNKQATNLAQSQFQALGGTGTDAKLDSAMHVSPNEALSKLGNQNIINLLKGNADAIAAKNREWQAYLQNGHGPQDYGKFSTEFNKTYDPRVFQAVYMTPDSRKDMIAGMTKAEKDQFRQSFNTAVERGWIPDPRKPSGG